MSNKEYRDAFVASRVRNYIAYQIQAMREERELTQHQFGKKLGDKSQSAVSRLEDPDYGKMSISTLLEVAAACDTALVVQFATFPDFFERMSDISTRKLGVASYSETGLVDTGSCIESITRTADTGGSNIFPFRFCNKDRLGICMYMPLEQTAAELLQPSQRRLQWKRENMAEEFDIAKLQTRRSSTHRSIYSNSVRMSMTPWDVSTTLSIVEDGENNDAPVIVSLATVRMSPQHFKAFTLAAQNTLRQFEEKFGDINLPPDVIRQPT